MKINFELTKHDYINFNLFHLSHSETGRKSLFIQRYVISSIFLIAPFILTLIKEGPLWHWLTVFVAVYILWVIFYPKRFKKNIAKQIDKMMDEGKNISLLGDNSIVINEDGIVRINNKSESKNTWDSVESIEQTDQYIFIYVSAISAYILPKHVFENKETEELFLKQVNDYLKEYGNK